MQVLCTNNSQHEKFDHNSAEIQSMSCLAQINLKKACMKNELPYVKQHLWWYEYD